MTKRYCDVPVSIAELIHSVYQSSGLVGYQDEKTLSTIAEVYYWNVDLFIKFIWNGSNRWNQERIVEWLDLLPNLA